MPQAATGRYFAALASAIRVAVMPERKAGELRARDTTVAVVVERAERVVALPPEEPERDAAEQLQARRDGARAPLVEHEPRRVRTNPLPPLRQRAAVQIEATDARRSTRSSARSPSESGTTMGVIGRGCFASSAAAAFNRSDSARSRPGSSNGIR